MLVFFLISKLWVVLKHVALTCISVADLLKKEQTYSKTLVREAKHTRATHAQQRLEEQHNKEQCQQKLTSPPSSAVDAAMQDKPSHNHVPASAETVVVNHQPVAKTELADWVSFQASKAGSVSVISLLDAGAEGSDSPRITTSMSAMTDSPSQDLRSEPIMSKAPHTTLEGIPETIASSIGAGAMADSVTTAAGAANEPVRAVTEVDTETSSLSSVAPLSSEQPAAETQQPQSADAAVNPVAASSVQHEPAVEQMADGSASTVDSDQVALVSNQHAQGAAKPPGAGDKIFEKTQEVVPFRREVSQHSTDPAAVTAQHTQVRKFFCSKLACWCAIQV